ncbi:thioredoxin [Roseibium denhamense]|uniref:Thioredoxin n=1 Tax=Roseibium denhamense TaxID=76305 RepID=A0ABY1NIH5_9HYPH|nr:thioredoxin family protein [Roseibium denhamense]MTI06706.1 thioredoxin [Roseibium denhamense]SMP10435.1 Thioredoxin [Roseibium denhamense]
MNRRQFIISTSALAGTAALLPSTAFAGASMQAYTPGLIQKHLSAGRTVFVDYAASWCSTCARQERIISALRSANPAYDEALEFVRVDWDDYANHEVTKSRRIPRRSTLLVLKGDQELGRIVAGTQEAEIKALMDTGLQAATS